MCLCWRRQRVHPGYDLPPKSKRGKEKADYTNLEYILKFHVEEPYIAADKSPFKVSTPPAEGAIHTRLP
jgi:hypothetical protein